MYMYFLKVAKIQSVVLYQGNTVIWLLVNILLCIFLSLEAAVFACLSGILGCVGRMG